jgi:hypothetical protein
MAFEIVLVAAFFLYISQPWLVNAAQWLHTLALSLFG